MCAMLCVRARRWRGGRDVPEDLFRHFVLPVRVNNERLDEFRMIYYDTLRRRVEGLSLHDAALEINHCATRRLPIRLPMRVLRHRWR